MLQESNNYVKFIGTIAEPLKIDHEMFGEKIYVTILEVIRKSGNIDRIPLRILEGVLKCCDEIKPGTKVFVEGEGRSFNKITDGKSHLNVDVFVKNILKVEDESEDINEVEMTGYICKPPVYRITPRGREITDIMIAINRLFSRTYYIPCIVWGINARWAKNLGIGSKVSLAGRFQSRDYVKSIGDELVTKTTREISIYYITDK